MKAFNRILFFLAAAFSIVADSAFGSVDPYERGEFQVGATTILRVEAVQLDHNLRVFAPNTTGTFKVAYFLGGFDAKVPSSAYDTVLLHVASHGYVVIAPEKVEDVMLALNATWLDDVDHWAQSHLKSRLVNAGFDEELSMDFEIEFIMGHSSGNHIAVNYLRRGCGKFQAAILMSPVDGTDPWGMNPEYCVHPGSYLNFELPTLIMAAGLDPISGRPDSDIWPPCAPAELSNTRFYDALAGPTWMTNSTDFGHADMSEPAVLKHVQEVGLCASNTSVDVEDDIYRIAAGGKIVAFLRGIDRGECEMFSYFEEPDTSPIHLEVRSKNLQVYPYCGRGFCYWHPEVSEAKI